MQAFRLTSPGTTELVEVAEPEPGPGEVLLRIGADGVCHSDLHIIDAPPEAGFPAPMTLGHENAGWVEELVPVSPGWSRVNRSPSMASSDAATAGLACADSRTPAEWSQLVASD